MILLDFLVAIAQQIFWVLYEGGLFILLGFAVAGAIHVLLNPERIARRLGERNLRSATLAALLGAPLPLCSCGVLPTATLLRRKGASRESTLSFLISTPETGVDSIAATLAFFGPLVAVVRPLVAVATALFAAALSLRRWPPGSPEPAAATAGELAALGEDAAAPTHAHAEHLHGEEDVHGLPAPTAGGATAPLRERLRAMLGRALHYAFVELFDELGFSLAIAIVLTGVLSAILPQDFFVRFFPSSFLAMVAMVVLSVPLYVCASASTPLAALFAAKGATAGAALVFLLVGPATNAATLVTVARLLGRATLPLYLGSIIGVAVAAGLALDALYPNLAQVISIGAPAGQEALTLPKTIAGIVLAVCILVSLRRTGIAPGVAELSGNGRAAWHWVRRLTLRSLVTSRVVQALALAWIVALLAQGFVSVPPGTRGLRLRLGRLDGPPIAPGLVYALPLIDRVELVRVDEVRELPVGYRNRGGSLERSPVSEEALYMTADENVIDLHAEVQYRVSDPVLYRLGVEKPDEVISGLARDGLVQAMANRSIDLVYTNDRAEVEGWLLDRIRSEVAAIGLGVEVLGVRLLDVHAPVNVHDAFRDIASAAEDRQTTIHRASQYAVGIEAVARGEAERTVLTAEGQADARVAEASGNASAFKALAAEHARAPRLTEDRMYIETAERVLPGVRKVIRPVKGELKGYELWLRRDSAPLVLPVGAGAAPAPTPVPPPPAANVEAPPAPNAAWQQWAPEQAGEGNR